MVTAIQAYHHIRNRRRDRRRLTLTFGDGNTLASSDVVNAPWWLDRADFTVDWDADNSAVFVWDGGWTLDSGDLPPSATGSGTLTQGAHIQAFDWFNGETA